MDVVYKAHDTKLNRTVTPKFLPAQLISDENAKARFIQEAQEPFYSMEVACTSSLAKDLDNALEIMAGIENDAAMMKEKAIIYGVLGDLETAFELLDRSYV